MYLVGKPQLAPARSAGSVQVQVHTTIGGAPVTDMQRDDDGNAPPTEMRAARSKPQKCAMATCCCMLLLAACWLCYFVYRYTKIAYFRDPSLDPTYVNCLPGSEYRSGWGWWRCSQCRDPGLRIDPYDEYGDYRSSTCSLCKTGNYITRTYYTPECDPWRGERGSTCPRTVFKECLPNPCPDYGNKVPCQPTAGSTCYDRIISSRPGAFPPPRIDGRPNRQVDFCRTEQDDDEHDSHDGSSWAMGAHGPPACDCGEMSRLSSSLSPNSCGGQTCNVLLDTAGYATAYNITGCMRREHCGVFVQTEVEWCDTTREARVNGVQVDSRPVGTYQYQKGGPQGPVLFATAEMSERNSQQPSYTVRWSVASVGAGQAAGRRCLNRLLEHLSSSRIDVPPERVTGTGWQFQIDGRSIPPPSDEEFRRSRPSYEGVSGTQYTRRPAWNDESFEIHYHPGWADEDWNDAGNSFAFTHDERGMINGCTGCVSAGDVTVESIDP